MQKIEILGIPIANITQAEALKYILDRLQKRTQTSVFTPGPEFLVRANKNARFHQILRKADILLPDGTGLILASFGKIHTRVIGADIVLALMEKLKGTEQKIGIVLPIVSLSSKETLTKSLREKFPNLNFKIYESRTPDITDRAPEDNLFQMMNTYAPDLVFVALGSPKQEYWINHARNILKNASIFIGVGGTFDYFTGVFPRAPLWMRKIGIEWLWRFSLEPKRFKRIYNAVIIFPYLVCKEKLQRSKKSKITSTKKMLLAGVIASVWFLSQQTLSAHSIQAQDETETNTNQETSEEDLPAQTEDDTSEEDEVLQDLNAKLEETVEEIELIEEKIDQLNKTIEIKQQEQLTLKSQLDVIDTSIQKTEKEIEIKEKEIELLELEIEELQQKILQKTEEIQLQKKYLAETLRTLYVKEDTTYLEVLLLHESFSDFFTEITYLEELEKETKNTLENIKNIKRELEEKKISVERKKSDVVQMKNSLTIRHEELQGEKKVKADILTQTALDEEKFQGLVEEVRKEQLSTDSEMRAIEQQVRERIAKIEEEKKKKDGEGEGDEDPLLEDDSDFGGPLALSWPIAGREITCGFDCADYPFRRYFKHSGMDIATPQGTKVSAAASGYVAIAKDGGATGYTYIMLVHGDGYATVYGHLSAIESSVYEKLETGRLVRKGEIIGRSGGTPGTPGAGRFSTGPHLHFELRENGIPINPVPFLP
ncbi:MAG: hypothetical protein A3B74_03950 [Candidatus Kerfeldbacteria bacterium RIFCSPHIGHO2_02_FULL_42_14]|uniref:Uncharacterized protein n=1 Tax=Candidatus Kerfeldbacteria bacterium RIFCSPHIGHO2_02_FULL_42_14 TaxID=1798540 RepID=A0A1G2AQ47_9BACT|nr:MAG: hypothetical protein A3B74_03950 [Candidatus Kerfeldbacteria bacterium RIFCSPHIGHO2_02_FULL_42_14]OGY80663.1 MAG: hypothetical protein A3E60_04445 [Candidatus Kerfeldbacteria bacterium RIFCSPHIGHO2_12_FULL_42_13]OGY82590.1 MAG: hypothetical protein A3I91_04110 [Candidatus Kerfeldbacteria bacterium RIFCSPLOWO2_02_FULL_42_19]OGY85193.1 MAG: hypothetical protein A3G01_01240 [Candidatus Kerfeldbacteria bacterium RIFCSPLOWO2_12_FULL_43_9]